MGSLMTSPALKPSVQLDHQMDNNSGQKQTETWGFDKGSGFHKITGGLQTPHTAGGILKGEGKEGRERGGKGWNGKKKGKKEEWKRKKWGKKEGWKGKKWGKKKGRKGKKKGK